MLKTIASIALTLLLVSPMAASTVYAVNDSDGGIRDRVGSDIDNVRDRIDDIRERNNDRGGDRDDDDCSEGERRGNNNCDEDGDDDDDDDCSERDRGNRHCHGDDDDDDTPDGGYGGGHIEKVTVCRATASRFLPWIKVTVPEHVAEKWAAQEPAKVATPIEDWPDEHGECPPPVQTIQEYVQERLADIFGRFGNRFSWRR